MRNGDMERARQHWLESPMWALVVAVVVTLCLTLGEGAVVLQLHGRFEDLVRTELRIRKLAGDVVWLDEVLTMSARMAAATGDPRWEARYRASEPLLDATIQEAIDLAPEDFVASSAAETDVANQKLVVMENQAFDLVRDGRREAAATLLFSDAYETQKGIYARGMHQVQDAIGARGEGQLATQRRAVGALLVVALLGLGLLGGSWIVILRGIARHLRSLTGMNEELEHRVAERTARLERERQRAVDAEGVANQASRAKSTFLANMSHELRTPLNVIIGYTELVLEEDDVPVAEARSDLQRVLQSGRHLLSLINDTLDLARIDADRMAIAAEAFRISPLIAEVVASVGPMVAHRHNELVVTLGDGVDQMCGDPARVRQCLYNLLSNAAKFTDRGRIDVDVQRDADWMTFAVVDTGTGIAPEQFAQLFQPFVQLDPSSTRRHDGPGLGLALTRRLCGLMGGDVEVSSVPGVGSRFTIRLPRERATAS